MRYPAIFFIVPLFFHTGLIAQPADSIKLNGQITMDSGVDLTPSIRLAPFKEGESSITTIVDADGKFNFMVAVKEPELFELKYRKYGLAVLLSPSEPACKVIIKAGEKDVRTMKTVESRENDAYRLFKKENKAFGEILSDLVNSCNGNPKTCLTSIKKKIREQNEASRYLRMAYKGTFAAEALASLSEFPETNISGSGIVWMQQHFFDQVDLTDKRLYNTPDLDNKISTYLEYLADTLASARTSFMQMLFDKTKNDKEAQKLLTSLLFVNFTGTNREPFIQTLVQWASSQPSLDKDQPVMASKIKLAARVLPGLPAPDVTGNDAGDKHQKLLTLAKKSKLTLLIFWESDCPHCRKAMPEFIRLYHQYHPKGLEVFAASLDSEKSKWEKFIAENRLEWTNVILPANSSAHADYFIQYTPTAVLIDGNGTIVRRFIDVDDLDKNIAAFLGK